MRWSSRNGCALKRTRIQEDYSTWAKDGGHQVITEVRFAQKLDERGFTKRKERQGMIYLGLTPRQGSLV